jgi:hypothetical protein
MQEYLSRTGEGGLIFFDQQQLQASDSGGLCGKLVMSFCKLEEGGLYVLGFVSEQVLKCLREEGARIKRQEEFGCALEAVLAEEDPEQVWRAWEGRPNTCFLDRLLAGVVCTFIGTEIADRFRKKNLYRNRVIHVVDDFSQMLGLPFCR